MLLLCLGTCRIFRDSIFYLCYILLLYRTNYIVSFFNLYLHPCMYMYIHNSLHIVLFSIYDVELYRTVLYFFLRRKEYVLKYFTGMLCN